MPNYFKYNLKNGVTRWGWKGYVGINPKTSKEYITEKRGFKTKKEAQYNFEDIRHKLLNSDISKLKDRNMTYNEFIDFYIDYKKDIVNSNTLYNYKIILTKLINHNIINKNKKMRTFDINYCTWIMEQINKKYGSPKNIKTILSVAFELAKTFNIVEENYFNKIKIKKYKDKVQENNNQKIRIFEKDEIITFLNGAKEEGLEWFVLFKLLIDTGMRHGEARALKWSDIDLQNQIIHINKTITIKNGQTVIGETTKNKSSVREVIIIPSLCKVLEDYKTEIINHSLTFSSEELVFKSIKKSKNNILSSSAVNRCMKKICDKYNLPYITPHGLRHTFVATAISADVPPYDIAHIVGHNDTKMIQQVYDAITEDRSAKFSDKFETYLYS